MNTAHFIRAIATGLDKRLASLVALLAFLGGANASSADCLDDAAAYHGVDSSLVHAIAQNESHMHADAVGHNTDGSEDIGLMQVNSGELPRLRKYGIARKDLFDPCVNAFVGTWIFKSKIDRYGATWAAVGAYNATTPWKQLRYAIQIHSLLGQASKSSDLR